MIGERKMVGIFFSGTGNTRHCTEKLLSVLDPNAACIALEDDRAEQAMMDDDFIIYAYPTQYSNAPILVRDYIKKHPTLWNGKKILCLNTMGLFSGDGTGCTARLFKKFGAEVVGGLQIRMPDSVCDSKALKKSISENHRTVMEADRKIQQAAEQIKAGTYPQEGLGCVSHLKGLFGQRLWFYGKTTKYSDQLKINDDCIGCGLCALNCPLKNIQMTDGKPVAGDHCTMCYRCISHCPKQAITLLGKRVVEQCVYEKYQ